MTELEVFGRRIRYVLLNDQAKDEILIDTSDWEADPVKALGTELERKFWFLGSYYRDSALQELWRFAYGGRVVDIYNFGAALDSEQRDCFRRALALFMSAFRDLAHWTLESIQVHTDEPWNPLRCLPLRGEAAQEQRVFKLFPYGMVTGRRREGWDGNDLEAVIVHEGAHVMVQPHIEPEWREVLGWHELWYYPGYEVFLSNGADVRCVIERPEECPTDYGSANHSDDIAESVAAFIYAPRVLSGQRETLLRRVLQNPRQGAIGELERLDPAMPELGVIRIRVEVSDFSPLQQNEPRKAVEKVRISRDDFARMLREGKLKKSL